jgi:Ion channel
MGLHRLPFARGQSPARRHDDGRVIGAIVTELTWRPGSRVARIRASHSYGVVLALIVVSFVFTSVASDGEWADGTLLLLQTLTFVTALWTSGVAKADSVVNLVLVALAAASALALVLVGGQLFETLVGIFSGLLTVATAAAIVLGIVDQREANVQAVTGAVCVYVLIGMMFLFQYGLLATLGSGDFFAQGTDGTRSLRLYFSYTTLATLGYGDYTPAGELGRTLAIVEALIGQLYLVTVIALLVSRIRAAPRTDR